MGSVTMADEVSFVPNYYQDSLAGFAYEADVHCVACSKERFGQDLEIRIAGGHQNSYPFDNLDANPPSDSEGNVVTAITGDMEFQCSFYCGDCGDNLSSKVVIIHRNLPGKKRCKYCGVTPKGDPDAFFITEASSS